MTAEVVTTTPVPSRRDEIAQMAPQFAMALGGKQLAERFVRVALTAIGRNPELADCTKGSLLGGLMTCAQLRLEPNDPRGLAYLIPFKNGTASREAGHDVLEAQLVIGYKGYVDLAYRSAQIKTLTAQPVCEHDEYEARDWPRHLMHKKAAGDRGKVLRYYAAVEYKDGGIDFAEMTVAEVEAHRDRYAKGASRSDSPWRTHFDEMAKKTVLRKLSKMMPMSVEDMRPFAAALHVDGMATAYAPGRSIDDLLALERPEAEQATTPPVTFAEIQGDTMDACPQCGSVPACDPSGCPGSSQEPML